MLSQRRRNRKRETGIGDNTLKVWEDGRKAFELHDTDILNLITRGFRALRKKYG